MARRGRLILIVDPDLDFVEDTRLLLNGERLLTARSLEEAEEIAVGGRIDAVVLGPSFGTEAGVRAAAALLAVDPGIHLVLAANVVTNRVLLAALQTGLADVVDTPLTVRKLGAALAPRSRPEVPAHLLDVVLEAAPPEAPATTVAAPAAAPAAPVVTVEAPPVVSALIRPSAPVVSAAAATSPASPQAAPAATAPVLEPPPLAPAPAPPSPVLPPEVAEPALMPAPVPASAPPAEVGAAGVVPVPAAVAPADPAPVATAPVAGVAAGAVAPTEPTTAAPPVEPLAGPVVAPLPEPVRPVLVPPPPTAPPMPPPEEALPPPFPPRPRGTPPRLEPEPAEEDEALRPAARPARGPWPQEVAPSRPPVTDSRVILVMAGKGGSGKSVTATNLALALTFAVGEDMVAIVDADLQFGDVALLLQMDPVRSVAEVAAQVDDLSEARLDALLLRHESGLRVLPAPLQPVAADSVAPKAVVQVVEKMRRLYRYVVVDTGAVLDDVLLTLLDHADDVVVVVDMDLPSVKNAKVALDILRAGGYPMERMRLVVNRINAKARLDLVELERSLGLRTAAAIPSDRLVPQSVNEGVPVVALSPRSRVARAFTGLAKLFLPENGRKRR